MPFLSHWHQAPCGVQHTEVSLPQGHVEAGRTTLTKHAALGLSPLGFGAIHMSVPASVPNPITSYGKLSVYMATGGFSGRELELISAAWSPGGCWPCIDQ